VILDGTDECELNTPTMILQLILVSDIGLYFDASDLSPFLYIGTILACFQPILEFSLVK